VIVDSSANRTPLSMTLLSSLTLPGQRYPRRAERASAAKCLGGTRP
jgi:hypothetical protein